MIFKVWNGLATSTTACGKSAQWAGRFRPEAFGFQLKQAEHTKGS
jgi:hypothetical protein